MEQWGDYNWRRTGVNASTYVHAILRHLNAWREGQDLDPESGRSHIAHIGCCCNILLDAMAHGKMRDDRRKSVPKRTAYLAGPMTGYPLSNFPAFDEARDKLTAEGWNVISPADMDRAMGFDPETSEVTPEFLTKVSRADALAILDESDAIAMLPGWQHSKGARAELALAEWKGIEVIYL